MFNGERGNKLTGYKERTTQTCMREREGVDLKKKKKEMGKEVAKMRRERSSKLRASP